MGIPEETGCMKWTAPNTEDLEAKRKGTYLIRVPRVKTSTSSENATGRSYVQGGLRVTECQVVRGSQTAVGRGSVLVITMGFHSRGILDVVAPVREVERDPLPS